MPIKRGIVNQKNGLMSSIKILLDMFLKRAHLPLRPGGLLISAGDNLSGGKRFAEGAVVPGFMWLLATNWIEGWNAWVSTQ